MRDAPSTSRVDGASMGEDGGIRRPGYGLSLGQEMVMGSTIPLARWGMWLKGSTTKQRAA